MKFKDLSKLSKADIEKKLSELNLELMKLSAQSSTGTAMKNPGQVKNIKKTIARIHTLQNKKEDV